MPEKERQRGFPGTDRLRGSDLFLIRLIRSVRLIRDASGTSPMLLRPQCRLC
jgi:hypothetical protein